MGRFELEETLARIIARIMRLEDAVGYNAKVLNDTYHEQKNRLEEQVKRTIEVGNEYARLTREVDALKAAAGTTTPPVETQFPLGTRVQFAFETGKFHGTVVSRPSGEPIHVPGTCEGAIYVVWDNGSGKSARHRPSRLRAL